MFRILLLGLAIYFAAKIMGGLFQSGKPPVEVHGKTKNKPLDLKDEDIEDVDFKETK